MGSGGSKEEGITQPSRNGVSGTGQTKNTFTPRPEQNNKPKISESDKKTKVENNNTKHTNSRTVTSKFESDSDSDDDRGGKRKGGNDSRTRVTNSNNTSVERERNNYNSHISAAPVTDYPETYAQRNQRAQYTKNEQMIRQKTIYRNPDEWQVEDEVSLGSFDISKFQQANKSNETKKEVFAMTPDYTTRPMIHHQDRADDFYGAPKLKKQMSVPKYDVTEEELMADIEKDFVY